MNLLTDFEDVDDPFDWELGTHGIHIHFDDLTHAAPKPTDSPASTSSSESAASTDTGTGLKNKLSSLTESARRKALGRSGAKVFSATYLPEVAPAQGWNKEETLDSAMRKAGYK